MSGPGGQEQLSPKGESFGQDPEEGRQQSSNDPGRGGGGDDFPYQQRAGGASYEDSPTSSPTDNIHSLGGYHALPPFQSYPPDQQGGLAVTGSGQYGALPPFPPDSSFMYGHSAPPSYGSLNAPQDRRPSHDSIGASHPAASAAAAASEAPNSGFTPQQSSSTFQPSQYRGGFLSSGVGGSSDPSSIPSYQQSALPPLRPGFQPEQMYGIGRHGYPGSVGFGSSGYSSDGAGSQGYRDETESSGGMGILPPHGAVRSASGNDVHGMGRRGNRRAFGARSGPGGHETSGSSPHQHPLGSPFFGGGASEGVSAALNMIGGPGFQGPPPPGGDGASPMPVFHPEGAGPWFGNPMDYPPPPTFGLGPPTEFGVYPPFHPEGLLAPPPGPPPGNPIQLNRNIQYGPEGANLFVFHVPNEWYNTDMYNVFSRFGLPISVRIAVENGRSKGYGFVSYDNRESAAAAINNLNGYEVHGKRLKVQHKRMDGDDRWPAGRGGGRGGGGRGMGRYRARSSPVDQRPLGEMPPPGGVMPPSGMIVPGGTESDFGPAPYRSAEGVLQSMLPPRANPSASAASAAPPAGVAVNEPLAVPTPQQASTSGGDDSPPADIRTQVLPPFPPLPQDDTQSHEHDPVSSSRSGDQDGDIFDLTQLGSELPSDASSG